MNKRIVALTLVAAALAVPALAQDKPVGISVRIGLFAPSDAAARGAGQSWLAVGADFKLRDLSFRGRHSPSEIGISMDYASKGGFRTLPVLLNYTSHMGETYFTLGAGFAFSNDSTSDSTRFAYQGALGYDFQRGNNPLFVEVKYLGNERAVLNGFAIFLGARL